MTGRRGRPRSGTDRLAGKVAVVTGAGSGIGRATALLLAREGARVHVVDIDGQRCEDVVAGIRRDNGTASAHVLDCSDADAVEALATGILSEEGRVDVVHLNAGIGHAGRIEDITMEQWRRVLDVNLWGVVAGVHAFVPGMLERGTGHVVITASGLGLVPLAGLAPYTTTKFALVGMAEALDVELRKRGVRVTAVCPGVVDTGIVAASVFSGHAEAVHSRAGRFFSRRGAAPERVAADVLSALRRPRSIVVSIPMHVVPVWVLHRISPRAYLALASRVVSRIAPFGSHAG